MGKFNGYLKSTYQPPMQWVLSASLTYDCDDLTKGEIKALRDVGVKVTNSGKITVKKGFITDMASVPRACWWLIAPFDVARAAVIHDLLYKTIRQYRASGVKQDEDLVKAAKKASDNVFLYGMRDAQPAIPNWKIYQCFQAVKLFGASSIKPTPHDYPPTEADK
jgi:hypothetical protein